MAKLDPDGAARLKAALEYVKNNPGQVYDGVTQAMKGVNDAARRTYLRHQLTSRVNQAIKNAESKAASPKTLSPEKAAQIAGIIRRDAFRQQQRLLNGIPEDDR